MSTPVLGITDVAGHVVVAYTQEHPGGNDWLPHGVALCVNPVDDAHHPYVVWTLAYDDTIGRWVASNGDYCATITDAMKHYLQRGGK